MSVMVDTFEKTAAFWITSELLNHTAFRFWVYLMNWKLTTVLFSVLENNAECNACKMQHAENTRKFHSILQHASQHAFLAILTQDGENWGSGCYVCKYVMWLYFPVECIIAAERTRRKVNVVPMGQQGEWVTGHPVLWLHWHLLVINQHASPLHRGQALKSYCLTSSASFVFLKQTGKKTFAWCKRRLIHYDLQVIKIEPITDCLTNFDVSFTSLYPD